MTPSAGFLDETDELRFRDDEQAEHFDCECCGGARVVPIGVFVEWTGCDPEDLRGVRGVVGCPECAPLGPASTGFTPRTDLVDGELPDHEDAIF